MAGDGTLSFVVPVRHHHSVSDWPGVETRLADTLRSIASQTTGNWRAVVVASRDTSLPKMPSGFEIARVDLPYRALPNPAHDREAFYEAVRDDKGRRVLAGLMHLKPRGHVMVVDYDDFVSRTLAAHVLGSPHANGWFFNTGYLYSGSSWVYAYPSGFHEFCGTSHLIRADLLEMPQGIEAANTQFIRRRLGSHRFIKPDLQASGSALTTLPFRGRRLPDRSRRRGKRLPSPAEASVPVTGNRQTPTSGTQATNPSPPTDRKPSPRILRKGFSRLSLERCAGQSPALSSSPASAKPVCASWSAR